LNADAILRSSRSFNSIEGFENFNRSSLDPLGSCPTKCGAIKVGNQQAFLKGKVDATVTICTTEHWPRPFFGNFLFRKGDRRKFLE
jgi:hypothetical protein